MPDTYDSYRQNPRALADPWALGGGPQQFYAPSASIWGNSTKGVGGKLLMTNPMTMLPTLGVNSYLGGDRRRAQDDAKNRRRMAVMEWRNKMGTQFGNVLGQQGADVRADLDPELQAALGAGGDMGDMGAINNRMTQFQQRYQQYMLGRQRAGQSRQVEAMMSDPRRLSNQQKVLQTQRAQGLGNIAEQYRIGQRNNAFNQARRGMQGGSTDVEEQGQLGRQRDSSAMGLQAGLDAQGQQFRLGNQQQKAQLMGLIHSDDPNTAAAFSRTLEGLNAQSQQVQENAAIGRQRSQLDSATSQGISQGVGGLLSAASRPLEYYVENRGGGA